MSDLGPVQIGAKEIYELGLTTKSAVEKLDGKLSGVLEDITDHEARIRALERSRWPLPSLAAIVGLAGLILALIQLLR